VRVKHTWKIWKHETMCRNLVTEKMDFSKEDDVVDTDIDRVMESNRLHARNLKDSYIPPNTFKTCTNVDNVMIKL